MKPPIADPFVTPPSAPENRVFRVDFLRSFLGNFCTLFVFLTPILWANLAPVLTHPTSLDPFSVSIGAVFFGALLSATISLFFQVKVDREGVQGSSFWGAKRKVLWSQITSVRRRWFIFPYAVIATAKNSGFLWLPLTLSDRDGFARAVEELAPAGNPLRLLLGETRVESVSKR